VGIRRRHGRPTGGLGSGSPDALRHRGPLRTVHATRRGTRLKQAMTLPCRSRRTPSCYCWTASSVLFTSRASNVSLGSSEDQHSSSRLTRLTSARFHGRASSPVSGRLYGSIRLEDRHDAPAFPAAFRPPALASWASCSRHGIQLPSRSACRRTPRRCRRTLTGFPRSTRLSYGRVGLPLYPGDGGVPTTIGMSVAAACRLTTASPYHPGLAHRPGMSD
jgi:hypothetical protein